MLGKEINLLQIIEQQDELIAAINKNIQGLKAYKEILNCSEYPKTCQLFDTALYIALTVSDMIVSTKYLGLSLTLRNGVESNFFSRICSVHLYDFFNDIKILTGKKFRDNIFSELGKNKNSVDTLYQHCSEINSVSRKHTKTLQKIRNNVIAHRNKNAHSQTLLMLEINSMEIFNICNQVWKLGIELIKSCIEIIDDLSEKVH